MSAKLIVLAGAALALALAGCGKSNNASQQAKDAIAQAQAAAAQGKHLAAETAGKRACDILTETVAKKYLGPDAALRRDAQPNPRMTQCQWGSAKGGVITVISGPWDMVYDASPKDEAVAGLGDEAHMGASGLYVRKGDHGINIDVMTESGEFWGKEADDLEARTKAAEKKVAPDLIANL
jgi:hypothetical protein